MITFKPGLLIRRKSDGIILLLLRELPVIYVKGPRYLCYNFSKMELEPRFEQGIDKNWDELK